MRALAIASALFSVMLFTLNGALARASVTVGPNGQAHVAARHVSSAVTARTSRVQARKLVTVRLPRPAT
jgi:hypothetical protein